jgi:hypothetical protein
MPKDTQRDAHNEDKGDHIGFLDITRTAEETKNGAGETASKVIS